MNLEVLYKQVASTNHEAALQAIYDKGFADGVAGILKATSNSVDPLTDVPVVTDVVTAPSTPVQEPANVPSNQPDALA